jgi:hypothetical protein
MFTVFSHVLAFALLFIDSLFDTLNDRNVPDEFAVTGIIGGLLLHGLQTVSTGSLEPLIFSITGGILAGGFGWIAYYRGFWGGADAMILTMIGTTIPITAIGEASTIYVLDLIFNFMISAVIVTVFYAGYKFLNAENSFKRFKQSLQKRKRTVTGLLSINLGFSIFLAYNNVNGLFFFAVMTTLIFLYEWIRLVEKKFLVKEVKKEKALDEVPAPDQGFGDQIRGLREEEIENYDGDKIKVRTGVPMIPVFLMALLITDLTQIGVWSFNTVF